MIPLFPFYLPGYYVALFAAKKILFLIGYDPVLFGILVLGSFSGLLVWRKVK